MPRNEFSDLTDEELVDAFGHTGDRDVFEMIKAEQRRREAERITKKATIANSIALASLITAILSLVVAIIAFFKN